jgi:hypothetical protein
MTTGSTHAREGIRLRCFGRGAPVRCFRVGWGGGSRPKAIGRALSP